MFFIAMGGGRYSDLTPRHTQQGMHLNEEMMKIFKDKVVGFPTLMEVIK